MSEKAKKYLLDLPVSEERLQYVEKECQKGFEGIADPTFSFYEFLPYDENNENMGNTQETLLINEVENGKCYELVITTLSGLYRYKTGDIIKIINKNEKELILEYSFRQNLSINIKHEKTTIIQIETTMKKINEIIPNIAGFLIGATIYNNIATYFLILFLDNKNLNVSLEELEKKLDYFLGEANVGYKQFRYLNLLGPSKIIIKNKEEFNEIQNKIKHKKSHNKQKFVLSEEDLTKFLKEEGYIN